MDATKWRANLQTCLSKIAHDFFESEPPKLEAIIYAEFDNDIGRVVRFQVPKEVFNKARFDAISSAIIPSEEMRDRMIKVTIHDYKILGRPVGIRDSEKYPREFFIFNLCFVVTKECPGDAIFEPLVQKCSEYLLDLERERSFLSEEKQNVPELMREIFHGLNSAGECTHKVTEKTTIYLKLCTSFHDREPPPVHPFLVPIFICSPPPTTKEQLNKMDVLSSKICPHINGVRCIKDIASIVQIDVDLVGRCIRNLLVRNAITLVPMFLYSDTYVCTEKMRAFMANQALVERCSNFAALRKSTHPLATDLFRLYLALKRGVTLAVWCLRLKPREAGVDERKFIQFGIFHGLVRKLLVFPVWSDEDGTRVGSLCNGDMSIEDLALHYSCSPIELHRYLMRSGKFTFISR